MLEHHIYLSLPYLFYFIWSPISEKVTLHGIQQKYNDSKHVKSVSVKSFKKHTIEV